MSSTSRIRAINNSKAYKATASNTVPNRFEGSDGEERIVYNSGMLRQYRKERNSWWYNDMTRVGSTTSSSYG